MQKIGRLCNRNEKKKEDDKDKERELEKREEKQIEERRGEERRGRKRREGQRASHSNLTASRSILSASSNLFCTLMVSKELSVKLETRKHAHQQKC